MNEPATVSIRLDGADALPGLWLDAAGARACLVLAHGAGAGMRHRATASLAEGLAARAISTLRFDFPFMARGSKRPDPPAMAQAAVRAAVAEARARTDLPLFAGGRSFGGRMTSRAQAEALLPGIRGLVFFAFPLHPAGKPSIGRADHLAGVQVPMLFLQGTRDALAMLEVLRPVVDRLGCRALLVLAEEADHAFHVPARTGRTSAEALSGLLNACADWMVERSAA